MEMLDILEKIANITLPIIFGVWTFKQTQATEDRQKRERREDIQRAERERDVALTEWGIQVIELMAQVEFLCTQSNLSAPAAREEAKQLSWQASALVERGRLFFPNVKSEWTERGYRPRLLDEVLRAVFVAKSLYDNKGEEAQMLADHIWSARRRFVNLLQEKTSNALYEVTKADTGSRIDPNPQNWPAPEFSRRNHLNR